MRTMGIVGSVLFLGATSPLLYGCAEIAGLEDREVAQTGSGGGGCAQIGALLQPTPIAEGEAHPRGVALDSQTVYWINEGTTDTGGDMGQVGGAVRRKGKAIGEAVTLSQTAPRKPHVIGVFDDKLYWVTTDTTLCDDDDTRDRLLRIPTDALEGVAPTDVWVSCGRPESLAFDETNVYMARPKAGRVQSVRHDDFDRDDIFTNGGDMIEAVRASEPWGVTTDDKSVYSTDDSGRILSYDKDAKSREVLVEDASGAKQPMPIASDAEYLYWITNHRLLRQAKARSLEAAEEIATQIVEPVGLAVHGNYAYFTDTNSGTVTSVPTNGCTAPVVIAKDQGAPTAIAADDSGVYWTNYDGGQVMTLPIPW